MLRSSSIRKSYRRVRGSAVVGSASRKAGLPSIGVDIREADFDVLGAEPHQTPAHHVQAGLAGPRVLVY